MTKKKATPKKNKLYPLWKARDKFAAFTPTKYELRHTKSFPIDQRCIAHFSHK